MCVPVFEVTLIFKSESTAIAQGEVVPFPRVECIKSYYNKDRRVFIYLLFRVTLSVISTGEN